jgi:hypothetical protein
MSQLSCHYTSVPKKRGPKVPGTARAAVESSQTSQEDGIQVLHDNSLFGEGQLWLSPVSNTEHQRPTGINWSPQSAQVANTVDQLVVGVDHVPTSGWAESVLDGLLVVISSALPSVPALEAVEKCVDLYMQYTFPTAPMIHEPTVRASASRFFSSTSGTNLFSAGGWQEEITHMQDFALITALCASVASVMPESLLPYRQILARPCLDTSRDMLRAIGDIDIENPNSTSIATRILHATALEHITGKTAMSYHVLGEATLIIRHMRLHSEEAVKSYDALEAQLLRSIFWQIYAADKASFCLGSRPILLHELLFDEDLTLHPIAGQFIPLIDTTGLSYEATFEDRLFVGFNFLPRLWSSAASLIFDVRTHTRGNQDANKIRMTEAYMAFLGIMDELPYWLQTANLIITRDDGEAVQFQKTAYWVQRCTILVTFQCLRLVILQQCIESKVWDVMGLNDQALTLPMTKIGMVHDFIQTLDDIPFVYLQVKGEPTVGSISEKEGKLLTLLIRWREFDDLAVCFSRSLIMLAMKLSCCVPSITSRDFSTFLRGWTQNHQTCWRS